VVVVSACLAYLPPKKKKKKERERERERVTFFLPVGNILANGYMYPPIQTLK
jgi:hypothetical protein